MKTIVLSINNCEVIKLIPRKCDRRIPITWIRNKVFDPCPSRLVLVQCRVGWPSAKLLPGSTNLCNHKAYTVHTVCIYPRNFTKMMLLNQIMWTGCPMSPSNQVHNRFRCGRMMIPTNYQLLLWFWKHSVICIHMSWGIYFLLYQISLLLILFVLNRTVTKCEGGIILSWKCGQFISFVCKY